MTIRQIGNKNNLSFIACGIEGEDRYHVLNLWNAEGTECKGFEIYEVDGCFIKVGNVGMDGKFYPFQKKESVEITSLQDSLLKEVVEFCQQIIAGLTPSFKQLVG